MLRAVAKVSEDYLESLRYHADDGNNINTYVNQTGISRLGTTEALEALSDGYINADRLLEITRLSAEQVSEMDTSVLQEFLQNFLVINNRFDTTSIEILKEQPVTKRMGFKSEFERVFERLSPERLSGASINLDNFSPSSSSMFSHDPKQRRLQIYPVTEVFKDLLRVLQVVDWFQQVINKHPAPETHPSDSSHDWTANARVMIVKLQQKLVQPIGTLMRHLMDTYPTQYNALNQSELYKAIAGMYENIMEESIETVPRTEAT